MERRQSNRWNLEQIIVVIDSETNEAIGHLLDINSQGMCVFTEQDIELNKHFKLNLVIDMEHLGKQYAPLNVVSVWSNPRKANDAYGVGFYWYDLGPKSKMRIEKLIDYLSK